MLTKCIRAFHVMCFNYFLVLGVFLMMQLTVFSNRILSLITLCLQSTLKMNGAVQELSCLHWEWRCLANASFPSKYVGTF